MGARDGDEVTLEVLRVAHEGVFVARTDADERTVLVPDTLPGERITARIVEEHPRHLRAVALEVLDAAPERVPHIWGAASIDRPPAARAGGAEFGHIRAATQRELKRAVLEDALRRIGRLDPDAVDALGITVQAVAGAADGTGSRTRVRLHAGPDGVGPFAARSHTVVPVDDMPLAVDRLRSALEDLVSDGLPPGPVELVAPSVGDPFALPTGVTRPPIDERVGDRRFRLEAGGFWQVHPEAPAVLGDAVSRAVDPDRVERGARNLDLYGGVGLLAAALAAFGAVTTVESDRAASAHAARNLTDLGTKAVAARVDRFLRGAQPARAAPVVVLDPPRAGAGRVVVDGIAALRPAQIVYVACDPVALARDLAVFAGHGWRPTRIEAFDLFPNTHHFETVAVLGRD